jgi:hypothetical protein
VKPQRRNREGKDPHSRSESHTIFIDGEPAQGVGRSHGPPVSQRIRDDPGWSSAHRYRARPFQRQATVTSVEVDEDHSIIC